MKTQAGILLLALVALSPSVNAAQAVFANGLEVAGKNSGVVIAFPDVSHTPAHERSFPGVPIPYPDFGMAGDLKKARSAVDGIVPRDARYRQAPEEARCGTPSPRGTQPQLSLPRPAPSDRIPL